MILDVVYNHVGPGSEAIAAFGPYFTDDVQTGWGDAIDYRRRGVREWAIQNAELWVRDYHVDGLRLDATHAVFDDGPEHVLAELAERVRAIRPRTLVIWEMETVICVRSRSGATTRSGQTSSTTCCTCC